MADNIQLSTNVGTGEVIRTDDDGTAQWQYVKLAFGADNTQNIVTSTATNSLPVALSDLDNAVLDNIQTAVELIDNAISGNEMQIDIVAPLPAGANNIGDVGILSVIPGTGATNLGKAEDAQHASADVGVMALSVRQNSAGSTSGIDGDYQPLITDTNGRLHVLDQNSAAILADTANMDTNLNTLAGAVAGTEVQVDLVLADVTNAGVFAVQISDTSFAIADGGALGEGVLIQGDDGTNRKNINVDATTGDVQVNVTNTVTVDGSGVTQPVSGTVTAVLSVTDNAVLDQIEVNTSYGDNTGGGVEAGSLRVTLANDSTGILSVDDNGGSLTVDNSGTFAAQIDGPALTALQLIDDSIFADDAAFTLASSKVNISGAVRDDTLSALTAVEGDAVPFRVNSTGALHVTGAGGGTQYNIDDAGGATDTGTLSLAIRDDALTTLTPADGDYVGLRVSSTGALHVTGGGGGTEYTEDVAAANPIIGTATVIERDDALTTVTPIEGDWIGLRGSAEGALWVQDFNSDAILVDTGTIAGDTTSIDGKITACDTGAVVISSGTITDITNTIDSTISGAALTALQLIDDVVYSEDVATPATIVGEAILMERDDALSALTPVEGDWVGFRSNARGALWVELDLTNDITIADGGNSITVDNAALSVTGGGVEASAIRVTIANDSTGVVSVDDGGGSITVDGTVTANPASGTIDTVTNLAQMGGVAISLNTGVRDTGTQRVTIATNDSLSVTNAGTFAVQSTLQANSGVDIGDVDITSQIPGTGATNLGKAQDTAVGATDTGVAMLVQRDDEQSAVTPVDGDYVVPKCDMFGNLKTTNLPDATSVVKYGVINVAASGDNTLQAAAGAGIKMRVLAMEYTCGGTVNVRIESAAAGTALTGVQEWVVNTGLVLPFNPAGWFETADNALLNMELSAAVNVDGCFTYVEI